jgi:hypothetical protein
MVSHKHFFRIEETYVFGGLEANMFAHLIRFQCLCGAKVTTTNAGLHKLGIFTLTETPVVLPTA